MATLLEYKCPACGGALNFDSDLQKMKCPYCDTEFEVEALKSLDEELKNTPQEDMSWDCENGTQWDASETEGLRSYVCESCGGEVIGDATTAATTCPYCDNPVVMKGQFAGDLRPDLVIPFQKDKDDAKAALTKHYSGKPLLPKIFKKENRIEEVKGMYVPFWLYDAGVEADINYRATRVRMWSDSKYRYTQTKHYSVHRAGTLGFASVPVDGSSKMPDDLMESLEPYDLSQAQDFQTAYLAGYLADKYDVSSQDGAPRANDRIRQSTEDEFRSTVQGYDSVRQDNASIRLTDRKVQYALYPVWMLTTLYKGERFTFAMNGQTGKMVGNMPVNWLAFWMWLLGLTLAIGAIGTLIFGELLICGIVGLVIGLIVVFIMKGQLKSVRKQSAAANYVLEGSLQMHSSSDRYLYQNTTRVEIPQNNQK